MRGRCFRILTIEVKLVWVEFREFNYTKLNKYVERDSLFFANVCNLTIY